MHGTRREVKVIKIQLFFSKVWFSFSILKFHKSVFWSEHWTTFSKQIPYVRWKTLKVQKCIKGKINSYLIFTAAGGGPLSPRDADSDPFEVLPISFGGSSHRLRQSVIPPAGLSQLMQPPPKRLFPKFVRQPNGGEPWDYMEVDPKSDNFHIAFAGRGRNIPINMHGTSSFIREKFL